MNIVASSPEGLEGQLAKEIIDLGAENIKIKKRFVSFQCNYEIFFKLHFYSRIPFRFYREVARFSCFDKESLYQGVQSSFDRAKWLPPNKSFCVQVTGWARLLNHSHFNALQVKNSIIDLQKSIFGKRSTISIDQPDLVIHVHLNNEEAILSLQSTSGSLHKRGYKPAIGNAPLKENVAAGLMQITQWNGNKPLIDIMCGSGTLLIEAASHCLNRPVPSQKHYLFENWIDFDKDLFMQMKSNIVNRSSKNIQPSEIIGCEINKDVFLQAKENINLAQLSESIEIYNMDFSAITLKHKNGVIVCNPPYGKKLGRNKEELVGLYTKIGSCLKEKFSGWEFWLLSGNAELTRYLRMKACLKIPVSNGGIDCRWIKYMIR